VARLVVETAEGIALSFEIAGAGSRCAAAVIDLLLWASGLLAATMLIGIASSIDPTGISQFVSGLLIGGAVLSLVAYHTLIPVAWDGRTPGKMALGIRVRDLQGRPATFAQQFLRAMFLPLEIALLVPVPIGVVIMAATLRSQRLGDLVASTIVVRDAAGAVPTDPYARTTWAELKSRRLGLSPALAARLDGEDLRFLRSLVSRPQLHTDARRRLFTRAARHYARVLGVELRTPNDPKVAHEVLRELYLFLREQSRFLGEPEA